MSYLILIILGFIAGTVGDLIGLGGRNYHRAGNALFKHDDSVFP